MLIHTPKELALLIIKERKKRKLTQATVGKLIGLKQQTISQFERKPERTELNTLFLILSAINLDIRVLTKNKTEKTWTEEW